MLLNEEPRVNFVAEPPPNTNGSIGQDVRITVQLTSTCDVKWMNEGKEVTAAMEPQELSLSKMHPFKMLLSILVLLRRIYPLPSWSWKVEKGKLNSIRARWNQN